MFVFVKEVDLGSRNEDPGRKGRGMARRGRKCVVADCQKAAALGSVVCQQHRDSALGEQTDREIMKMTRRLDAMAKYEEGEAKREAMRAFRRQVMRGEYAALFSTEMVQALRDEGRGYGLQMEIGMMRMAMLRLMLEEENPSRMAHGLAKLSGALGKSMERQAVWDKTHRAHEQVQAYWAIAAGRTPAAIEERGVTEARGGVFGADGDVETVAEEGTSSADWLPPGYPDYYTDVEDLKGTAWGTESEEAGASEEPRIARGKETAPYRER